MSAKVRSKKLIPVALAAATMAGAVVLGSFTPAGAASKVESHCVIRVIGKKASGEFETSEPRCYAKFSDAMANSGVPGAKTLRAGATSREVQAVNGASTSSFFIGVHYDGAGLSGSSMSVTGDDCSGGWLNTASNWSNRISSTSNGCYRIRHFDGAYLTGGWADTTGSGGNVWIDNATESIQYLAG
jgi:hypothetical protein